MINAVEVKPAFEFHDLITDRYYKIYADGRVAGGAIGQIINRIPHEAYKHQEIKMTREEAHAICFRTATNYEGKEIDSFLRMLEALGLIKFDAHKPKTVLKSCDCSVADVCPQGVTVMGKRCLMWVNEK